MTRIAIIEHDPVLATELRAAVEAAGFQSDCFTESAAALSGVRTQAFALAILELGIRDADPFAICSETSGWIPVIAVTADHDEDVCLRAFASGADDCLARPFTSRELGARIQNLLRRAGSREKPGEDLVNAVSAMRVRVEGETHRLSRGEAEVLALLLASHGAPMTVLQLLERLPPKSRVKRGTIESRIKSLRRKLGAARLISRGRLGYQVTEE